MIRYNWEQKDWPKFSFDSSQAEDDLYAFAQKAGHVNGVLHTLPDTIEMDTVIDLMVLEAIKSSEIEGEYLSRKDVHSSIRKNLGLNSERYTIKDKKAKGIGELMADVRRTYKEPLSKEKLFSWHRMLMAGEKDVETGTWRTHKEPMQIVSGAMGKQKVHFEAPPSLRVPKEMDRFILWFNDTAPGGRSEIKKAPVRAAVAHLYFETIHPFEDGNGRLGRAIAEKALSQGLGQPAVLSLSKTIEADKKQYYLALQKAQKKNEITSWINYFVGVVSAAQDDAAEEVHFTLKKARFYDHYRDELSARQLTVINRMLAEGAKGFEGGMNAAKYTGITKTSKATATRDMQQLVAMGVFLPSGGGRSTSYQLNLEVQ